jgi:hypothetical protein
MGPITAVKAYLYKRKAVEGMRESLSNMEAREKAHVPYAAPTCIDITPPISPLITPEGVRRSKRQDLAADYLQYRREFAEKTQTLPDGTVVCDLSGS